MAPNMAGASSGTNTITTSTSKPHESERTISRCPLSDVLPPLVFGTATFNSQYNSDPFALDTTGLIASALSLGIRAFDTSPYYGPSEELLGSALAATTDGLRRDEYFLLTKVGRVRADEFDYSPAWVSQSVRRSCARLRSDYLDVVYCHDVEFVTDDEVLAAVRELRRLRDEEKLLRYVGISGYPLDVLGRLAERILVETGEPLDIVMSYANFTLQNAELAGPKGIKRLRAAGVDVVPNASPLGMGLLRHDGPPVGGLGDWHPATRELRSAVRRASDFCDRHGERLEVIAIRWALETWLTDGASVGSRGDPASGVPWTPESNKQVGGEKLGVSVMGVSNAAELEKTMQVWRSILDGLEGGEDLAAAAGRWKRDHEWSLNRKGAVQIMADGVLEVLDEFVGFEWESPPQAFREKHEAKSSKDDAKDLPASASGSSSPSAATSAAAMSTVAPMLTPAASPQPFKPADSRETRESSITSMPLR